MDYCSEKYLCRSLFDIIFSVLFKLSIFFYKYSKNIIKIFLLSKKMTFYLLHYSNK